MHRIAVSLAPQSPAAGSTAAAEQLGTVAPSAASTAPAITGTADVHAAKTTTAVQPKKP